MRETRILIVEDESITAMDIQGSLIDLGYVVQAAVSSGTAALEAVARQCPDLILMDIRLEGEVNGIQAANQIRARFDVPIVYLTAHSDDVTLQQAKITEPFGYILKPFYDRDLHKTIEIALYKHKVDKELKDNRRWLATMLNSIGDAVIATNAAGQISFMNPIAEVLTGWGQEEAVGRDIGEVFSIKGARVGAETPIAEVIRKEVASQTDHALLVNRNGREIPIASTAAPIKDESLTGGGERRDIRGGIVVFRDVTEQRRAERALRESESRYRRRSAELQALYDISLRLNAQLETSGLLDLIVEQAVALLGAEGGNLYIYDPRRDELIITVASLHFRKLLGGSLKPGEGLAGQAFQKRRSMAAESTQEGDGRSAGPEWEVAYDKDVGVKSLLSVPLWEENNVVGVLNIAGGQRKPAFDEQDIWLAELFAAQASIALENVRLHAETRRAARELAAINKTSQAITSILDVDAVLQSVLAAVKDLLVAEAASVLLHDPVNRELVFAASSGANAAELMGTRMPATAGVAGAALQRKCPILVSDVQHDDRFYRPVDAMTGLSTRALLAVPLMFKGEAKGVIEAVNKTGGDFDERDLRVLESLAASAIIAIENARLFSSLTREQERLSLLYRLSRQLLESLDVHVTAQRALESICKVVGATQGMVLVCESGSHSLSPVAISGYSARSADIINQFFQQQERPGLLRWAADQRQTVVVSDVTKDERWWHVAGVDDSVHSVLGVPLLSGTDLVGVMGVYSDREAFFDHETCRLVESAAATIGVAIANAQLFQAEREQFYRLQESQMQLIHAEKMAALGRLTASFAHEINNPLQAMQSLLELAEEELANSPRLDQIKKYLGVAGNEVDRIAHIVRRMREFYRPARNGLQLTDVHALLENTLELTGKQLQHKNIVVVRQLADNLPAIEANPDYLKQVFLNMVLNAIDAMTDPDASGSKQGGTLYVRTAPDHVAEPNGQMTSAVRIEFTDTGAGMSQEVLSRLFDPFFTTKSSGTGLGLSICYGIIEAHRGHITAASQPGAGTTFTIVLPARQS